MHIVQENIEILFFIMIFRGRGGIQPRSHIPDCAAVHRTLVRYHRVTYVVTTCVNRLNRNDISKFS